MNESECYKRFLYIKIEHLFEVVIIFHNITYCIVEKFLKKRKKNPTNPRHLDDIFVSPRNTSDYSS